MIMPNIVRILLDEYGFRGAALIMASLAFHGLVGAALFQPVEWHMKRTQSESCFGEKRMLLQPCRHRAAKHTYHEVVPADVDTFDDDTFADSIDDMDDHNGRMLLPDCDTISINSEAIFIRPPSWKQRISTALDLDLLCDIQFVSIAIGLSLGELIKRTLCNCMHRFYSYRIQIASIFSLYCFDQLFHAIPVFFTGEFWDALPIFSLLISRNYSVFCVFN